MNDMSDSKHKELLEAGLRAVIEEGKDKKIQASLDRFAGGDKAIPNRRSLSDVQKAENPYAETRALLKREKMRARLTGQKFRLDIKSRSVAAFMFLPQFHMTFRHASHIYPLFMRFLASLLVQAGLLPENHLALRYGQAGVRKVRFKEMMGDTWFRLRTMRGVTLHHYGIFSLVVLMVLTLTATLGAFFTRIFLGVGTASAQLFFTHPGDPYGMGVGVTDTTAVENITPVAGGSLFDGRVEYANQSTDYGLMVLDKILRQAAADTPTGGAMQNALAAMMGTYNTGITIVGSVVLLWMITSIVIDTAKAGVFGGGRHNMVWAPIRVMFAALLLLPLGTGFSTGQYAVMKIAEWGSNFGTRAWGAYVNGVLTDNSLLAPFATQNASGLVHGITKVITCQVVYNTQLMQSQGGLPGGHVIRIKTDVAPNSQLVTNRYTNNTGTNICGTIKYSTGATQDDIDNIMAAAPTAPMSRFSGSTPVAVNAQELAPVSGATVTAWHPANSDFKTAAVAFRKAMRGALQTTLADSPTGALGGPGEGAAIRMARNFACRYATHKFNDGNGGAGPHPVSLIPNCDPAIDGTLTANVPTYPNFSEQVAMQAALQGAIMNQYETVAKPILDAYVTTNLTNNMIQRGWAGMGMFLQEITAMNKLVDAAKTPVAIVEPGTAFIRDGNAIAGQNWLRCAVNFLNFNPCRRTGQEERTVEMMESFEGWWETQATASVKNAQVNANQDMTATGGGKLSELIEGVYNMAAGDNGLLTILVRFFIPSDDNVFLFRAVDVAATGTYPLAQLIDTGNSVLGFGAALWGIVSLVQAVSSFKLPGFSLGMGLAIGALTNLFVTLGSAMILAGIMMSLYLPALPMIRVAFSVLTWMITIFEAVVMVPVAALGHLVSTGDGLTAGNSQLRTVWMLWLNILMRPVLTVIGFVGGLLIYNTFAVFFHTTFAEGTVAVMSGDNYTAKLISKVCYSVIYLATLYTAANMCFKLMDVLPEHMVRWMGGSPDQTMRNIIDKADHSEVYMRQGARTVDDIGQSIKKYGHDKAKQVGERENQLRNPNQPMTTYERQRAQKDSARTYDKMSAADKREYNSKTGPEKDAFLADKFMQQNAGRQGMMSGMNSGLVFGGPMGISPTGGARIDKLFIDKNLR